MMIAGDKFGELILDVDNEGSVLIHSRFFDLDDLSKLDALKDWITDLQEVYNETLEDSNFLASKPLEEL